MAKYFRLTQPFVELVIEGFSKIKEGYIVAHTGYYFMKLMIVLLPLNPKWTLELTSRMVQYASASGYSYDFQTQQDAIRFTELLLADHRAILNDSTHFERLLNILYCFAAAGWQSAMSLIWKMSEIF